MRHLAVAALSLAACSAGAGGAGGTGGSSTGSSSAPTSGSATGGGSSSGGASSGGASSSGAGSSGGTTSALSSATSSGGHGTSSGSTSTGGTGGSSGGASSSGSSGAGSSGSPDAGPTDGGLSLEPGNVAWLMNDGEIGNITKSGPDASYLAQAYFDNPTTYITGAALYSKAVQAMDFKAAVDAGSCGAALVATVDPTNCASVPANFGALTLDIEGGATWCSAPDEKQNPIAAYEAAYAQVAAFNKACRSDAGQTPLLLIGTPGTDLTSTFKGDGGCSGAGDAYHQYICLGLAGGVAAASDIYEVQAQSIQENATEFQWFVAAAAAQARAQPGRANMEVLAGLTADQSRLDPCDPTVLYTDVVDTFGTVQGYWLNVFGNQCDSGVTDGELAGALLSLMSQ